MLRAQKVQLQQKCFKKYCIKYNILYIISSKKMPNE